MLGNMHLVLISGLSGSGKSVALKVLEDADYYCVDNLPSQLLQQLVGQLELQGYDKVGVVIDIRGGDSVAMLPLQLDALRANELDLQFLFLDAQDATLIKRYSETRRRHPLASDRLTLTEAIAEERIRLGELAALGHHIDTSGVKASALREWVRQFVTTDISSDPCRGLTLLFESFGFKNGIPTDADFVFDARTLPNPYWEPALQALNGRDAPVIEYLEGKPEVQELYADIAQFIEKRIPLYQKNNRAYLTVAIGCTGGQHRSVYLVERLAKQFGAAYPQVIARHSSLPAG